MAIPKLTRTTYGDPTAAGSPRPGAVRDDEALLDHDGYDKPLEQTHGSALHGWGVASGLEVGATAGAPNLQVTPGVALDVSGQHIVVAPGGFFVTGSSPTPPAHTPPSTVSAAGLSVPTAGLAGSFFLTIQF